MSRRSYYDILSVARGASLEEIKRSYRRLALRYHPDKNPGDSSASERFKEITEAYSVLSDAAKRARYDRLSFLRGLGFGRGGEGAGQSFGFGDIFEGLFRDIFGGFAGGASADESVRGNNLRYTLELGFEEGILGTQKSIHIPCLEVCPACEGSGAKPGVAKRECPRCKGSGEVRLAHAILNPYRRCPQCEGRGSIMPEPCPDCVGSGRLKRQRHITVKVPPGVRSGTRLRMAGEGDAGLRGGEAGDLFVVVRVRPHPFFSRKGNDVVCEVPVSFPLAALGGELEVPTLDDPARVVVPPGTQCGTILRLKGGGVPVAGGNGRGDQQVRIVVRTPTDLTARQRRLLQELARLDEENLSSARRGWWSRVRDLLMERRQV